MDKISNAIKCASCCSILISPVLLPCGHSICKSHAQKTPIRCVKCGKEHQIPKEGFPDNISLIEILDAHVHQINLGKVHEKAKQDTKCLESLVIEVNNILKDPAHQSFENIKDLRKKILLRRDEFKLKIDCETKKLIKKLENCELNYKNYISGTVNEQKTRDLVAAKNSVKQSLEKFKNRLDQIIIDDEFWKGVCVEIESEQTKLANNLKIFNKSLTPTGFEDLKRSFSKNIDIDFNYLAKSNLMGSNIIDPEFMKYDLMRLCEFPLCQNWELLYRGSENNFSWTEFHNKCTEKSPTLVIVKSKDGGIVGGYTEVKWNDPNPYFDIYKRDHDYDYYEGQRSRKELEYIRFNNTIKYLHKFKSDLKAFQFVLKYPIERKNDKPGKAKLPEEKFAIYCDNNTGPSFGKFNFFIQANLKCSFISSAIDAQNDNYSKIDSTNENQDENDEQQSLSGEKVSQLKEFDLEEIEVFLKIIN